ncbi:hypothetical protein I4U23_003630 [Adineta vaga]|nr:hypothetical protein I4U23_003630 [Adineta vaga]
MASNNIGMNETSAKYIYLPPSWPDIRFSLYLVGEAFSIPCYLFVFYHLLARKAARKTLYNHSTIVVLLFNFISLTIGLPLIINYSRRGFYVPFNPAICYFHQFVDYGIWYGAIITMVWLSLERHILIFHSNLVSTARGRLIFHYIPLACVSLYSPIFYFCIIFIRSCEHNLDATSFLCGGPWYRCPVPASLSWYMAVCHDIAPIPLIIVISGCLLIRVVVQKHRLQRANGWRQNRKMILQFIFIAATYIIFDLPLVTLTVMRRFGITNFGTNVSTFISPMANTPAIVISYATVITLPDLKQKLRMLIFYKPTQRHVTASVRQT